ncbi:C25 family cysteine peptidase [Variovorax sp. J22R133]|uniref:C25 family cysteine peptidase n=1 Tax=Variovorax brevis TaxID=3053503 RepID=UPI00257801E2|nr:C25 family cysteine peptidase [Variovorax sp. J22R133]MDM0112265.1 C25 family cysteine peptidase [Variovorax sp. J22R133]
MSDDQVVPLGADDMPLPMGVQASTGQLLPGLTDEDLKHIDDSADAVQARGSSDNVDFLAVSDVDPNKLDEAGWGVIFAQDADPAIRQALEPLIEHRRKQVNDTRLFKLYEGAAGYRPNDTVAGWLARSSVGLAIVDPLGGVPLYLLLVGSPAAIPFEFQYLLDTYWSVGRLDFDTAAEYRAYAEGVVAYETAATVPHRKRMAIFSTRNPGDRATALLMDQVATPLVAGTTTMKPVGERQGFQIQSLLGDAATKENLQDLLREQGDVGPPALLFTGSHGVSFALDDMGQRERQGAILCGDWPGGPVKPEHCFAAADVPADAKVSGLIHFFFACYGGGCPQFDTYSRLPDGKPKQIAAAPMVARLPQKVLASGALAVIAHIDRAWSYSFQVGRGAPQVQEFRDVLVRAMKGERIGACTDQFNLRWAVLSAELSDQQRQQEALPGQVSQAALANRWVARDDARNYLTLGDPAVRLRVEDMRA